MKHHHMPPRTFMRAGRPHLSLAFSLAGKKRSHPVQISLSPEESVAHDHNAFLSRWKAHYATIEAEDDAYRAYQGRVLQICHHSITITDFKLQADSPAHVRLIAAYVGEWGGLSHSGTRKWESDSVARLPSPDAAFAEIEKHFSEECEQTHSFERHAGAILK